MEGKSLPSRAAVEEECWVRMSIGTSNGLETCTTGARTLQRTAQATRPRLPLLGLSTLCRGQPCNFQACTAVYEP
jgi:hypothetical protein